MKKPSLVLAAILVVAGCSATGVPTASPSAAPLAASVEPSADPTSAPTIRPRPRIVPPDLVIKLTKRGCSCDGPEVFDAGPLLLRVENQSDVAADVNLMRGHTVAEGGLPPEELLEAAELAVREANEAIQDGREPAWPGGEYFSFVGDILLPLRQSGPLAVTARPGTWFGLCFLGASNSEKLPVFLTPPFTVK